MTDQDKINSLLENIEDIDKSVLINEYKLICQEYILLKKQFDLLKYLHQENCKSLIEVQKQLIWNINTTNPNIKISYDSKNE